MARTIRRIQPITPPALTRVAAYARVSNAKDAMLHSLSAQVSYYSNYIQKHPGWQYIGVYADEGITGTKDIRPEFQRLLYDCKNRKIDMIITKSISRFARNTLILLETVRELSTLGVDVYFEKESIHTTSGDGELILTILASFAQEESLSVSENCKWRIRGKFKEGLLHSTTILGYRIENSVLKIEPEEAKIVQMIFTDYLSGMGRNAIAKKLNAEGYMTRNGKEWLDGGIDRILRNEKYAGDMLLQKTYNYDHISKRKTINKGILPMYYVKDSHEPIIDRETFEKVQDELNRRTKQANLKGIPRNTYPFTGKIICSQCGKNFRRKISHAGSKYAQPAWICTTFNSKGKKFCNAKQIPEDILLSVTADVLGLKKFDDIVFEKRIIKIQVPEDEKLIFEFSDGSTVEKSWQDKSRRESWDDAAKQEASERQKRRNTICQQQER